MPRDFFPFVEEEDKKSHNLFTKDTQVSYPARIAVYDDPAVTPRVVIVEPNNIRDFLSSLTAEVTRLSHEQGGTIPFTIIREIVENYIHAAFIEPTITILDNGNTIRFCDQGPGIKEKQKALEFGTTSANDEMKHYIRGVGSGLPIAQQYMLDKGGSLSIHDNISSGTIITISTKSLDDEKSAVMPHSSSTTEPATVVSSGATNTPSITTKAPVATQVSTQNVPTTGTLDVDTSLDKGSRDAGRAPLSKATSADLTLSSRGQQILSLFSTYELIGGKELVETFGGSQPTWSRELKQLDMLGITYKYGQKRKLTALGKTYIL